MASNKKKSISIRKYKNKRELNIGIFLFAIVFIYLIVTVIAYLTDDNISVYEVREGSIVNDTSYTGLIIRQEETVNADSGGYVNYYQNANSKVKSGSNIYALSSRELDVAEESSGSEEGSSTLNSEVQAGVITDVQNFSENFDAQDFSTVYSLKNEITTALQSALSQSKTDHLDAAIEASGQEVTTYKAARDGIVAFSVDGKESLTKNSFTEDDFDRSNYEVTSLHDQMQVSAGDPVYRMITSEDWSVIVQLDEETAKELTEQEVTSIRTRIDKDSETMWADFSVIERGGVSYGCLDFDNSMVRYADDRYLSIELILEDESGLKIPKSSVAEEAFFVIPQEYVTTGGNSSSQGVLVSEDGESAVFQAVDIFNISDDGEAYISRDALESGTLLLKPESSETYTVEETKTLTGVYNINRGYAVFRKVTILCENDEYYIVAEGEDYGLSNYDHIVQDSSSIDQKDVVFE
ncbi:hypothetical protein H6B11_08630 [Mediterraneibacter glycyrrhizinilyticus]|nr:HlyD family efflux transporter periplasmic adaptor subunit [Mediterraneibacter glycyrrhizinilyticus]MBM6854221.1 hypothetical protein [Mediterraneibacter glycyrrhizinilyticus]